MLDETVNIFNFTDKDGNPSGGCAVGTGINILWQNGPLGRGEDRLDPNGAFVETVIDIAKRRLEFYQESKFKCDENEMAIKRLDAALSYLNDRTKKREERKVEGTHAE